MAYGVGWQISTNLSIAIGSRWVNSDNGDQHIQINIFDHRNSM